MRVAFKEWAIVVDALLQGGQFLILRKGGIREGKGGFKIEHNRFLLFPTLFHQQRESVIDPAQDRYDVIAPTLPGEHELRFECFVELAGWKEIEDFNQLRDLAHLHIWRPDVIEERFDWGKGKSISILAVRARRLATPVTLQMVPEYGGCKSWIETVEDISTEGAEAVIDDASFADRIEELEMLIGPLEKELPTQ